MRINQNHLQELNLYIRANRSQEASFEKLLAALNEEINSNNATPYKDALLEIKEKAVEDYTKAKESGGSAWPEFERFVSAFEKAVIEAGKHQSSES